VQPPIPQFLAPESGVGSRESGKRAEEQRSRGAEEQRSRGAEEQRRITTHYPLPITHYPRTTTRLKARRRFANWSKRKSRFPRHWSCVSLHHASRTTLLPTTHYQLPIIMKLTRINYSIAVAWTLALSTTIVSSTNASEDPLCYLQTRDGRQVDLSKLCDRSTSPMPSDTTSQPSGAENPAAATGNPKQQLTPSTPSKIGDLRDPNARIDNPVIRSDKPPAFWNSIPDLPSPPAKGRTTNQ